MPQYSDYILHIVTAVYSKPIAKACKLRSSHSKNDQNPKKTR